MVMNKLWKTAKSSALLILKGQNAGAAENAVIF